MKKFNVLNSFSLKIIAMVTMALDHLAFVLQMFWNVPNPLYLTLRTLGRIAMPLYAFMIVEGVLHTRSYKKYSLRLGIMTLLISIFLAICYYVPDLGMTSLAGEANIFMDLLLGSLMIYLLNQKNKYLKPLALLPLGLSILSFVVKCIEFKEGCPYGCAYQYHILWYPEYLRFQYDWLSLVLMLGFYLAYKGSNLFYKIKEEQTGLRKDNMVGTNEYRISTNIFAILALLIATFMYYIFIYIDNNIVWWDAKLQIGMLISGLFIFFYSGLPGYRSTWFNHFFTYLYYPLHIILIYGICYLIYLI